MRQLQINVYQDGILTGVRIDSRELQEKHGGDMDKYIISRGLNPANIFGFRFVSREDDEALEKRRPPVGDILFKDVD